MIPGVCALLIWAALSCSSHSGEPSPSLTPVTLTNERPTGLFAVAPETLKSAPSILALSITKVVNTGETAVGISVYLTPAGAKGHPLLDKVLLGNFSLYPPDHPAGFLMPCSSAFHRLALNGSLSKSTTIQLLIQMKRIHEEKPWTPVTITIAPPEWRHEKSE